jgi:hypothetical protein
MSKVLRIVLALMAPVAVMFAWLTISRLVLHDSAAAWEYHVATAVSLVVGAIFIATYPATVLGRVVAMLFYLMIEYSFVTVSGLYFVCAVASDCL